MSRWFTCRECNKQFEYQNEAVVAQIEPSLKGARFVCDACGGTSTPLPDAVVTLPPGMKLKIPTDRDKRSRAISPVIA